MKTSRKKTFSSESDVFDYCYLNKLNFRIYSSKEKKINIKLKEIKWFYCKTHKISLYIN